MTITLAILADTPRAATGMAVVNHNLAYQLSRLYDDIRVIYFARFEARRGFAGTSTCFEGSGYEVVPCEGGVWKAETVEGLIEKYNVDILYAEDDWWSMAGLVKAAKRTGIPFYFMSPIDSLPIQEEAKELFRKYCYKVFVPNQSYKYIPNGVYLPHSVDYMEFRPVRKKAFPEFTFLWIGRDERRKALGRVIVAYERIYKKYDCKFVVRSNWGATPMSRGTDRYIKNKKLPILQDKMTNCPHSHLAHVYSACNAFICSSKAGACEMSIKEANACMLPVLATDWTFMCENIVDGKNGFLIPVESYDVRGKPKEGGIKGRGRIWGNISIKKLAEKMEWMIKNQDDALEMGIWGLNYIRKEQPKWEEIAETFMDTILDDLEDRNLYKIAGEI